MTNTFFFQDNTYNTACSILSKLGYNNPLKTIVKGDRTQLKFKEGIATFNEETGTLKLIKYLD